MLEFKNSTCDSETELRQRSHRAIVAERDLLRTMYARQGRWIWRLVIALVVLFGASAVTSTCALIEAVRLRKDLQAKTQLADEAVQARIDAEKWVQMADRRAVELVAVIAEQRHNAAELRATIEDLRTQRVSQCRPPTPTNR